MQIDNAPLTPQGGLQPYRRNVYSGAATYSEATTSYNRLPIIPLHVNSDKISELTPPIEGKINAYDLLQTSKLDDFVTTKPLNFSHSLYNREQLRVLLANDDVANQPFSKIAFRNYEIHGKVAQNAVIRRLQNQLAQGLVLGESIDLIQRLVKSEMVHTSMWQARRIVRTETLRTANRGR